MTDTVRIPLTITEKDLLNKMAEALPLMSELERGWFFGKMEERVESYGRQPPAPHAADTRDSA